MQKAVISDQSVINDAEGAGRYLTSTTKSMLTRKENGSN
jgi:hypothetical protein